VNQDLLNRLQSEDFRTYSVLSHATADFSELESSPSMSDVAELERLGQDVHGLGEPIYDDATDEAEFDEFIDELGIERA
jgi:hypothetical protein